MSEEKVSSEQPRHPRDSSATIKRILAAAREEFGNNNGFDGTKVEHIARRAKVSKQLVYLYFNGKEDLYAELAKEIARTAHERLLAIDYDSLDPFDAIRAYVEGVYDFFLHDQLIGLVAIDQSLHDGAHIRVPRETRLMQERLIAKLDAALLRGRTSGQFGDHFDVHALEFMTLIIVTGCVSSLEMFERYVGRSAEPDLAIGRDTAVTFILRALRA